jgi:hypothetical protein
MSALTDEYNHPAPNLIHREAAISKDVSKLLCN